jgi:hypothetical protein
MNRHAIIDETCNDPDLLLKWASPSENEHVLRADSFAFNLDEPSLTDVLDWDWWEDESEPRWVPLNEYIKPQV